MANIKITSALLVTAILSMIPHASAEQDSTFTIVNLARDDDATHRVASRGGSYDLESYQGGIYKVGYDACQAQIKSATAPVNITISENRKSLTAENVPAACMTIGGALTNNYAEGNLVPMGSDKMEITNVTEDTIDRVQSMLGVSTISDGSDVSDGTTSSGGGNVTSTGSNSTSSTTLSNRFVKHRISREASGARLRL